MKKVNQFTQSTANSIKGKNKITNMKFQTPKGTRDLSSADATNMYKIIRTAISVFQKFGFEPLITPAFESFDLLSAKGGLGEAVKDEIYFFKDKSNRELGLRFDLTMPFARVIASNPQLPKPFKRYSIDKVWRYDNPQAMRWREFWQADIDVAGTNSVLADVECIAAACEVLDKIGFKEYKVRVNNRKILQGIFNKLVDKEKINDAFRIVDKLEKIGPDNVEKELEKIGAKGKKLLQLIKTPLQKLEKDEPEIKQGFKEISDLMDYAKMFGIEKKLVVDLSLVRGLEYYTGLVFEINLGVGVSCGGGGRYDNLIEKISGQKIPATGISLGLDRILEVMKEKNLIETENTTKVFVANVDDSSRKYAIEIANELRKNKINCQIDLMEKNIGRQLEYVDSAKIPFTIIIGKEEVKKKKIKLKDMKKKTERVMSITEAIKILKS